MEEKKTPLTAKITIVVLAISCILLAAALAILYLSTRLDKNKSVAAIAQLETNLDEKQSIIDNETISIETFKNHAQQYGASIPFLQSFFDDVIVYKNKQGIVYQPIDDSLPKNTYDFSKLTYKNSQIQYDDNSGVVGLKGIDVSKYQKSINWQAVKEDGVSYAIIRAGHRGYAETGQIAQDPYLIANLNGASKAGVDVGVYFFSQAITKEEAVEEADFVLNAVKGHAIRYPIVFDMEEIAIEGARTANLTAAQITDLTIAFCERIKSAGYTPMIYGNVKWMMEHVELSRLTAYQKWFAQYYNKPFFPYEFQIWQYTNKGKVNGITGEVDLNLCFVNYNDLPVQ